jgi:DnaK suppressor protein
LSQAQLEELADRLAHKHSELKNRVEELERQMLLKDDCSHSDAVDAASLQEGRIRARGIVEQDRQTIAEIDAALRRLSNGQYGVSEVSGEPIAYQRLLLVPWARTGVDE